MAYNNPFSWEGNQATYNNQSGLTNNSANPHLDYLNINTDINSNISQEQRNTDPAWAQYIAAHPNQDIAFSEWFGQEGNYGQENTSETFNPTPSIFNNNNQGNGKLSAGEGYQYPSAKDRVSMFGTNKASTDWKENFINSFDTFKNKVSNVDPSKLAKMALSAINPTAGLIFGGAQKLNNAWNDGIGWFGPNREKEAFRKTNNNTNFDNVVRDAEAAEANRVAEANRIAANNAAYTAQAYAPNNQGGGGNPHAGNNVQRASKSNNSGHTNPGKGSYGPHS